MLKSSELAGEGDCQPKRWMLVPQRKVGNQTASLAITAPLTWKYLQRHAERIARRGSQIYKGQPEFAVFGLGDYTFAPWKVAISGLYKRLTFRRVGPFENKPIVFDDTCSFIACPDRWTAEIVHQIVTWPRPLSFFRPESSGMQNGLLLVKSWKNWTFRRPPKSSDWMLICNKLDWSKPRGENSHAVKASNRCSNRPTSARDGLGGLCGVGRKHVGTINRDE